MLVFKHANMCGDTTTNFHVLKLWQGIVLMFFIVQYTALCITCTANPAAYACFLMANESLLKPFEKDAQV